MQKLKNRSIFFVITIVFMLLSFVIFAGCNDVATPSGDNTTTNQTDTNGSQDSDGDQIVPMSAESVALVVSKTLQDLNSLEVSVASQPSNDDNADASEIVLPNLGAIESLVSDITPELMETAVNAGQSIIPMANTMMQAALKAVELNLQNNMVYYIERTIDDIAICNDWIIFCSDQNSKLISFCFYDYQQQLNPVNGPDRITNMVFEIKTNDTVTDWESCCVKVVYYFAGEDLKPSIEKYVVVKTTTGIVQYNMVSLENSEIKNCITAIQYDQNKYLSVIETLHDEQYYVENENTAMINDINCSTLVEDLSQEQLEIYQQIMQTLSNDVNSVKSKLDGLKVSEDYLELTTVAYDQMFAV